MAFNEANVDNRLRHLVRGRVIVFTTSEVVEFLQEDLRASYPLFYFGTIPSGMGAVFMVELNGYLTFDPSSYVKITKELAPYQAAYFDPSAYKLIIPADPFRQFINGVNPLQSDRIGQPDGTFLYNKVSVVICTAPGQFKFANMVYKSYVSENDISTLAYSVFPLNGDYLGDNGYPDWTYTPG